MMIGHNIYINYLSTPLTALYLPKSETSHGQAPVDDTIRIHPWVMHHFDRATAG